MTIARFAPVALLAVLLVAAAAVDARIADPENLRNIVLQATPIALLALGAFMVLVSGGIDLSMGHAVALVAIITGNELVTGTPVVLAAGLGLLVALGLGLVNGVLVGVLRLPPFIATLGTMTAIQGLTLFAATKGLLVITEPALAAIGRGYGPLILVGLVGVVVWIVMRHTRFGLRTYAIGSDEEKAILNGVSRVKQQLLVYILSGLFGWLTAVLTIGRIGLVQANMGGVTLLLDAIAAAVIGGTSIFGGRGTVGGVLVGALIISLLGNALQVFDVDPSAVNLYKGLIIVMALVVDSGMRAMRTLERTR